MDGELVSGSLSVHGRGEPKGSPLPFTYTERFYELFPYYLSIGMSAEQYWDGDPTLVKYYRKAEAIRTERMNYEKWLQGIYIYEAICDVSPVLHAFAKKGSKPRPYADKPYAITVDSKKKDDEAREKAVAEKGRAMLESFMKRKNNQENALTGGV